MTERLKKILKDIDSGKITSLYNVNFTYNELLSKDENGITFLEQILKRGMLIDRNVERKFLTNIEFAYIYCKNDEPIGHFKLDEKNLFSKINGQTYIEYFIEKGKYDSSMLQVIKEHYEIIDILIKNELEYYLKYLNQEIIQKLTTKNSEGIYLIEKYINNKKVLNELIKYINDPNVLINLYEKYNNEEILKNASGTALMSEFKEYDTFLEYLINEKNIIPEYLEEDYKSPEIIKIIIKNNLLEYLKELTAYTLLTKLENDQTILEYLLDKGYNPLKNKEKIHNKDIIRILFKNHRIDLLVKSSIENLLELKENNKTYFEYIVEAVKDNIIEASLSDLRPAFYDNERITKYYLIIAKHDMMEYVINLDEKDLLDRRSGTSLIEMLLEADSNLTLNKILTDKVKANPKIVAILKSKGFETPRVKVPVINEKFNEEYINGVQNTFGIGPFQQEGEILLSELQQLFLSDERSDKELITQLIIGYREALLVDYETNIKEIKNLINIKKQNKHKFIYKKNNKTSYFSPSEGSVYYNGDSVKTLIHETAHALHYYLIEDMVPENYQEIILAVRNNPETLKKIEEYSVYYNNVKDKVRSLVEERMKEFFSSYYTKDRIKKIKNYLKYEIKINKKELKKLGVPRRYLRIIQKEFNEEEYIAHQKEIYIEENEDAIMRNEFGEYMAIGDILDAIYQGKLKSGILKNEQGEKIKKTSGHGIIYYYDSIHGFDEMVANFALISKSKRREEMLELLKSITGEEFYNMLSNFYYRNIIGIKEEEQKNKKDHRR